MCYCVSFAPRKVVVRSRALGVASQLQRDSSLPLPFRLFWHGLRHALWHHFSIL